MTEKAMPKLLHGLGWLVRTSEGVTLSDRVTDEVITTTEELGEGRFELHWHRDFSHAKSFANGIAIAGRNSVTAVLGLGDVSQAVLVLFAEEETPNTTDLNEAIKLVQHSDAARRQGEVAWSAEVNDLIMHHTPNRHRNTSAPPIRIKEETPDALKLEVKYANWFLKESTWNPLMNGGWYRVDIKRKAGKLFAEFDLTFETLRDYNDIASERKQQMLEIAQEAGGTINDTHLILPIGNDIGESFKGIHPLLERITEPLFAGLNDNRIASLRANKDNQRVGRVIADGGEFRKEGKQWLLVDKNGKAKPITEGRIHSVVQAGLAKDPFPKIDYAEFKV